MKMVFRHSSWLSVCLMAGSALNCIVTGVSIAQEPPSAPAGSPPGTAPDSAGRVKRPVTSTAQIDAGEPRAKSPAETGDAADSPAGAPAAAHAATPAAAHAATPAAAHAAARAAKASGGTDRLDLSTATVTGDREQPKVMYIVPWKRSDIGDLSGKPMNSLLDEALAPVDRDEFKREVAYFDAVQADTSQNGASHATTRQVEK